MYCSVSAVTFKQMFDVKDYPVQESGGSSLFSLLRPSIHVVVYKFASSAQMKMLRKIVGCESFETSREHLYDGVFLSKVTSLQCSHCNFAINRTHHGFFLEYLPKTGFLKKCQKRKSLFFEKTCLWWTRVLIKLQPCTAQP